MRTLKLFAPATALLLSASTLFASTTGSLTEYWDYETNEMEEVINMGDIPAIAAPVVVSKLRLDVEPTIDNFFSIDLPYAEDDVIGVVVYDKRGKVVFNQLEKYKNVKNFLITDNGDNQYTVKVYKDKEIHEAKVLVTHKFMAKLD